MSGPAPGVGGELVSAEPNRYRVQRDSVVLLGSRSDATGSTFWPPRLRCPQTGAAVTPVELATTGTVWTWTFVHVPWHGTRPPGPPEGYVAGLVDLDDDGPRVPAVLFGDAGRWMIGDRVRTRPLPMASTPDGVVALVAFDRIEAQEDHP